MIGRARLRGNTMTLETNSKKRADGLRKRIEKTCGHRVRYVGRAHADPLSSEAPRGKKTAAPPPPTPEMNRFVREYKERHYADWADHPLPALAGQSPREAVRTRRGREAVFTLLKEMEYMERQSGDAAYDFSGIRSELGIL